MIYANENDKRREIKNEQLKAIGLHYIEGNKSAKYWVSIMNDLKARGMQNVLIFCTDNLTGLNDTIDACYPTVNMYLIRI